MQASDLIKYIKDPQLLDKQSMEQLQKLAEDFPYFQPAHLLLSMASKKWDASVYQHSLKKTAIVAPNRAHLFNLIHRIEIATENTGVQQQTIVPEPIHEKEQAVTLSEETKHGLDILKATEIATGSAPAKQEAPAKNQDSPAILEEEIQKSVVTSFVEKEILNSPGLHQPKAVKEPENFVEWLALLKKNNGQPHPQPSEERIKRKLKREEKEQEEKKTGTGRDAAENTNESARKEKQKALIDKIIENNPGIIRSKEEQKFFSAGLKARESLLESEDLVTETLARIYALQGSVNKAVRAYEILSLKFPQKSAYFATLIQKLKSNL